jgi:hypothetical protein
MVTNLIRGVILGFFAFCLFRYCSQENRVPWSSARKPAHQSGDIAVGYLTSKTVNTIGTQKERKPFFTFLVQKIQDKVEKMKSLQRKKRVKRFQHW